MENKQKAIQEAYGENWEAVKNYVDENGWIDRMIFYNIQAKFKDEGLQIRNAYWRPKSLRGIENNNGWTKIESEADLPTEKIKVWFFTFGDEKIGTFHPLLNEFRSENNFYNYASVTHYQPIIKPKKPIY